MSVIKRLNGKGITVLLITHFMEEAAQADKIIVMDRGVKKMEGTPEEIFLRADEAEGSQPGCAACRRSGYEAAGERYRYSGRHLDDR